MKRRIILFCLVSAILLSLFGCAKNTPEAPQTDTATTAAPTDGIIDPMYLVQLRSVPITAYEATSHCNLRVIQDGTFITDLQGTVTYRVSHLNAKSRVSGKTDILASITWDFSGIQGGNESAFSQKITVADGVIYSDYSNLNGGARIRIPLSDYSYITPKASFLDRDILLRDAYTYFFSPKKSQIEDGWRITMDEPRVSLTVYYSNLDRYLLPFVDQIVTLDAPTHWEAKDVMLYADYDPDGFPVRNSGSFHLERKKNNPKTILSVEMSFETECEVFDTLTDILPPADAESYEWRDFSPEGFAPAHIE